MTGDGVLLWSAGIIISIAAAVLIMRRSIRKRLAVFLDGGSSVFKNVDDSLREALQISFEGQPVRDLWHVELIVANTGETSNRDYLEPLSLALEGDVQVLDASVIAASPENLDAKVSVQVTGGDVCELQFTFPMLNEGDWGHFAVTGSAHASCRCTRYVGLLNGPAGTRELDEIRSR